MEFRKYVHNIAIDALLAFPEEIKKMPERGWQVRNITTMWSCDFDYSDCIYSKGFYFSYSFAEAVMIAADAKAHSPMNDIFVEPNGYYQAAKDEEICRWALFNNRSRKDYTTMENMAAGRLNMPNNGGYFDSTYDKEYKEWIENII